MLASRGPHLIDLLRRLVKVGLGCWIVVGYGRGHPPMLRNKEGNTTKQTNQFTMNEVKSNKAKGKPKTIEWLMKLVWLPLLELCLMNGMGHQGRIARGKPKENKLTFSSFINTKRSVDEMNEESFVFLRRERLFSFMNLWVMGASAPLPQPHSISAILELLSFQLLWAVCSLCPSEEGAAKAMIEKKTMKQLMKSISGIEGLID